MESPITNCWGEAKTVRLGTEEQLVQRAAPDRSYHHHQQMVAAGGRLYATFSSGHKNEDDAGQRIMLVTSDDLGATWTEPRVLVEPPAGQHARAVTTATGLHAASASVGEQPLIVAYYGQYEYTANGLQPDGERKPADAEHCNTGWWAVSSRDAGRSWSEPLPVLDDFISNIGPTRLASGRLVVPGSAVYPYTDDPDGLADWTWTGLPGLPEDHVDDSAGFQRCRALDDEALGYCEGSIFQTDDGVVHTMLRSNRGRLAVTESDDNGETWSTPRWTTFTDNSSRHQFGRLPDGRFFALSTPAPQPQWQRTPLVLAVSADGVRFDRHFIVGDEPNRPPRFAGMHKGGRYGYPYLAFVRDMVVVLYSVAKEDVATCRFPLAALD